MDDPILVRAGRGMAPTPFALRGAPRVRSLLDEASALISADRELPVAELRRTLRSAALPARRKTSAMSHVTH
jgi:DNA-binding transcriptional LysR family regulator